VYLGLVEGLDDLGGGLLAAGLDEDELHLGQHLGLPVIHISALLNLWAISDWQQKASNERTAAAAAQWLETNNKT
jgi:hypothetical protein